METIEDRPLLVTLDTGVLDEQYEELERAASALPAGAHFVIVTVSDRERGQHETRPEDIPTTYETAVIGEWRIGMAVLGSEAQATIFEQFKNIIGHGSDLTQHQLRDATIFETHVREGRDVFITIDQRHFISHGRREQLEALGTTRIMLPDEFIEWCRERSGETEKNVDRVFDEAERSEASLHFDEGDDLLGNE